MHRIKGIKCVLVKDSYLFECVRIVFLRSPLVPLTTGGGSTKAGGGGGSQNFGYLLWGYHENLGTFYGGGVTKSIFLLIFTKSNHLRCQKFHGIVTTHEGYGN